MSKIKAGMEAGTRKIHNENQLNLFEDL